MADRITKKQRSKNMAAVKSKGNKSTEQKLLTIFKKNRVKGWRRHSKKVVGTPDFVFPSSKLAVFVDGCFWHGCKCSSLPKTNREFWTEKIGTNKKRDKVVNNILRNSGWKVLRIQEHQLKRNSNAVASKLKAIPELVSTN